MTISQNPRLSKLRRHPTPPPPLTPRLSVLSSTSTGAPLSFSLIRKPSPLPVAGLAISEAASYLYTAQHLLRENRPGRATDYLKSSLGLFAALVASARVNDVIAAGIGEAHFYLARCAHVVKPTPEKPEDARSHLRRAELCLAMVGDGVDIEVLKKMVGDFGDVLGKVYGDSGSEWDDLDEVKCPLEELGELGGVVDERGCYDYFRRCAFPRDMSRHPALMFGRQRASNAAAELFMREKRDSTMTTKKKVQREYRKRTVGRFLKRRWSLFFGGEVGKEEKGRFEVKGDEGRKSMGDVVYVREKAVESRRRLSLSHVIRRKGLSPGVGGSDTITSSVTDQSVESNSMAKAQLRRNPTTRGLAAPVPTRSAIMKRGTKAVKPQGFLSRISHAIRV